MYLRGWRAYLALAVALLVVLALAAVLLWVAVGLAIVGGLAAFNYVYLPLVADRLRLPTVALAGLLLPLLLGLGWWAAEQQGLLWGGLLWVGGVAAPRLAAHFLARRLRAAVHVRHVDLTRASQPPEPPREDALEGVACPRCGLVSFLEPGATRPTCPRCQSALPSPA